MLYGKRDDKELDIRLFENPTSEYRGAPFWSWNAKLDKDMLLSQIESLKEMGFGGFHMHTRTGLDTEYLGDEYMEDVLACCNKAEQEKMLAWLYDEDRWSSGPAGGKVTRYKKFRRKRLNLFTEDKGWNTPKEIALETGEPYLIGCYDVILDNSGYLSDYKRISVSQAASGVKWYAYVVNEKESGWFNNQTYVDAMDKEAIGKFIEVTYARYAEYIEDKFGKSVPAIFTDEPNASHEYNCSLPTPEYSGRILYGWSRFFEEKYKENFGSDILDTLPELFWIKKDRSDSIYKYRYFELVARLFSENYCAQIGNWCDEHGLAFTGHLLREPNLIFQSITCGETMRCYPHLGIPGIDMLCDMREFTTAKQAQSAVHQYGKEGMLSELYGVTNWDFDFRGHKFQGDWQAALGVTVRVPHLAWLSMAGEAKRDYPAAIGYQSPWYKEYPFIENHFARVNTALTRGNPIVRIGVIHPVESSWITMGPNSQLGTQMQSLENGFQNITEWLLQQHLDFDFICESQLPYNESSTNPRAVGKMCYDAIVVPHCITLRTTTVEYLERFKASGGKVIFIGKCPEFIDGVKNNGCIGLYESSDHSDDSEAAIATALESVRNVSIKNSGGHEASNFVYNYRSDNDCNWLFIAHSCYPKDTSHYTVGAYQYDVVTPEKIQIVISGRFTPHIYNTLDGKVYDVEFTYNNDNTVITAELNAFDSMLIKLDKTEASSASYFIAKPTVDKVLSFDVKNTVEYQLSEPNVLLLDKAEYAFDDGEYQGVEEVLRIDNIFRDKLGYMHRDGKFPQPYVLPAEPATHVLHLRYAFESEIVCDAPHLAIEDAEKLKIRFNGEDVAPDICGYFTDKSIKTVKLPQIKKGNNILEIEIPFGKRTNVEWCYILGDFGVRISGCSGVITKKPERIGFGDICHQGLPFYGANITYKIPVCMPCDGSITVHSSYYKGSLIGVSLDGAACGRIVLPPYNCVIENVAQGEHVLELTLFGNRHNSFGALHRVNEIDRWYGPNAWRSTGDNWSYEYNLKRAGILKSPIITVNK